MGLVLFLCCISFMRIRVGSYMAYVRAQQDDEPVEEPMGLHAGRGRSSAKAGKNKLKKVKGRRKGEVQVVGWNATKMPGKAVRGRG